MYELVEQSYRFLPHLQETGREISLTWRLEGELPQSILALVDEMKSVMRQIEAQPNQPARTDLYSEYLELTEVYDDQLGKYKGTGIDLSTPVIAEIITTAFHFYDSSLYELQAYCVMPNHVHLLILPLLQASGKHAHVSDIVRRIKGYTSKQIKAKTPADGAVWRADYFDRFIRDDKDRYNVVEYILNNPLKAGLAEEQRSWPYNFAKS